MTDSSEMLVRSDAFLSAESGGRLTLLGSGEGSYFTLNGVAARIWRLLEQPRTAGALVSALRVEFDGGPRDMEEDVRNLLEEWRAAGLLESFPPRPQTAPPIRRMQDYLQLLATNHRHPRMPLYPGLPSSPWYEAEDFRLARVLEENFPAIQREVDGLLRTDFRAETEDKTSIGIWDLLRLYELGIPVERNRDHCPVTASIFESHRAGRSPAGILYVSRMTPGTHIRPHRGTTNLRVLCHLALRIPRGDCAIRVGGEARPWREGRCIVFDDYYEHEAWNFTAEDRIVLMLDLWHPDLTGPEIAVLEGLERHAVVRALDLRLADAASR